MMAIDSMTIAYSEKVKTLNPTHIRCKNETILVLFERISGNIADCRSEGKLRYHIVSFIRSCFLSFMGFLLGFMGKRPSVIRRLPEGMSRRRSDQGLLGVRFRAIAPVLDSRSHS
jgi:hypothetical protein